MLEMQRSSTAGDHVIQPLGKVRGAPVQIVIYIISGAADVFQGGAERGHGQRMTHKCSGKKRYPGFGDGGVAKLPISAVERVHEGRFPGQNSDRHSPAYNFSVGHQIGVNTVISLSAARMDTKSCDYFVEDERGSGLPRDFADTLEKLFRLQIRMTALDGLNQDCGKLVCVLLDISQRFVGTVIEHGYARDTCAGNSGRDRLHGEFALAVQLLDQHFIELAVIVPGKKHHPVSSGHGAREAHGRHDRFRSCIAEGDPLGAGHLRQQIGGAASQRSLRADGKAFLHLLCNSFCDKCRRVPEHGRAETVEQIDIFIAVDVPELRTRAARGYDAVNHFLPLAPEAADHARVRQGAAMFLGEGFRASGFL